MENFNERETGISKIITSSDADREVILEVFKNRFNYQVNSDQEEIKTPDEIKTAEIVIDALPEFVKVYGGSIPPVTSDHVHSISEENRDQYVPNLQGAGYAQERQRIYTVNTFGGSNFLMGHVLGHEFLHFASFQSFSAKDTKGELVLTRRRQGFEMEDSKTGDRLFRLLDEAVIEELSLIFSKQNLETNDWLKADLEKHVGFTNGILEIARDEGGQAVLVSHAYEEHRKSLRHLVNDLFEKNRDIFNFPDEVFTLFAQGALKGNVLDLARLIEKTYGKGWFRKIGEMMK